ncbi:HdaI-type histone deacetylase (plasmid) [Natrialba magadii ATCC 43099]|uniref:Histone deacetylase n=1 Tax=Natrialba magadii (strain ATCC 43099 / DSM 3394 / CCM 3739 / CIP 104546 / IAM 13178 / JCM 8861 / NBRC 102185 / NCIMB 2190 / MS3) TaxID=547559 RepID=D3T1E2_NATMM|nr:class II histone deacetylase [Natrialba magadii]ADD07401.1 HdaI-type histone deacetylase [Natrialba magadii ATCC 43099]ELY32425.1 histone deacetylase [Natrialba magadii ATCC 43099]
MGRTITAFWDESFIAHEQPAGEFESEWTGRLAYRQPHPDRPERLKNIYSILQAELADHVTLADVEPATRVQLERTHTADHIDDLQAFCADGGGRITAETGANEHTFRAATHAAGAACLAAEHALEHSLDNVPYAMVRPSGHHAQPEQVDGFCYFNNVAVAADHILETTDTERVAIVDWDVHHGNGTQECFEDRDDVLVIGIHNDHWSWDPEAHPQTGDLDEVGTGDGEGYNVNVPLPPGTGDEGYEHVFDRIVEPLLRSYDPDLLLISAGQDAGTMDPLGRNVVTKGGFEELGRRARVLADEYAGGNLAVVQEGGYQVSHLAYATLGVLEGVLGVETGIDDPMAWMDEDYDSARRTIEDIATYHSEYWPALE